jgi:hypothetical protein
VNTLVRTLLVWLVLVAVPFQGLASAAMRCAHGIAPAGQQQAHRHEAKPPCHAQAAQEQARLETPGEAAGQSHDQKCGSCAACSIGTAMAPASTTCPPDCCPCSCCPGAAPGRVAQGDPDLPERPPRVLLA